jgi:hypothetical protein
VDNLDEAITYYGRLGHELIWRRPTQAGLRLPDTDAELVVQTENPDPEIDLLVGDADARPASLATQAAAWFCSRSTSKSVGASSSKIRGATVSFFSIHAVGH